MENLVLIDWLSITSKTATAEFFAKLIGMPCVPWDVKRSPYYDYRNYFQFISIHHNSPRSGAWLEMSGQGCRVFEDIGHGDYEFLFSAVAANADDMMITRLDIAFDDHTGILDLNRIMADTVNQSYVAKARKWLVEVGSDGTCVYIGSKQSPVMIRIYDKAAERHRLDEHWIRVEMQLRDSRCMEFVKLASSIGLKNAFSSVLLNYLRFVDGSNTEDSNIRRWPVADYWSNLIGDALPASIYVKPGIEYNLDRCENYVFKQAGNAIAALLDVYNDKDMVTFLLKLEQRGTKPNPKYVTMIENARAARLAGGNSDE